MASWDGQTTTPDVKLETSPADSFLSAPGDVYPPLFGNPSENTMNPLEIMTPRSLSDEQRMDAPPSAFDISSKSGSPDNRDSATPTPEKKQTKKRKSWGQVLPEPKTNLPPRKRAKTEDEKEQRRVERVLRNRRAAQSSRERKRLEVEALEQRNNELESMLRQVQQTNLALVEELHKFQRSSGVVPRSSPSFDALRQGPVTFSQELFSSQDGHNTPLQQESRSIENLLLSQSNNTVNPASLSPSLSPVPEGHEDEERKSPSPAPEMADAAAPTGATTTASVNASPDETQHPAAMLCPDLQCPSAEASRSSWLTASRQPLHPALALFLPLQLLLTSTSAMISMCRRPLMQIAMSSKAGFSLPPTLPILNTIIWLVTTPQPSPSRTSAANTSISSTSTNTSTTSSTSSLLPSSSSSSSSAPATATPPTRRSSTLRLKSLRKILSSSPTLARPLMDATMAVLRLASSEGHQVDRVSGAGASEVEAVVDGSSPPRPRSEGEGSSTAWLDGAALPSKEVLLTLLWAIRVEERRIQIRNGIASRAREPGRQGVAQKKALADEKREKKYVLKVMPKRAREAEQPCLLNKVGLKRRRTS